MSDDASPPPPGPLAGIRVLDLATARGELAGRLLADLGAEVIKVEPPGGAEARRRPPFVAGREADPEASLFWAAVALGKRSVVLDLADPAQRARLLPLVDAVDVLIESSDPGALDALGLGYDVLAARNPALVYVSITPFGQEGPKSRRPATELTVEAAGGLVALQGDGDRPPVPVGYPQAAFHAAAQAAADAVIALNERAVSGRGQHLDTSMQDAIVWTLLNATGFPPNVGREPPFAGDDRAAPRPALHGLRLGGLNLLEAADGWVLANLGLGLYGARVWEGIATVAAADGRLDDRLRGLDWAEFAAAMAQGAAPEPLGHAAVAMVMETVRAHTKAELMELAVARDMMVAAVQRVDDLVERDPQLAARGYWTTLADGHTYPGPAVRLSRTPVRLAAPAPALGADQALLDAPPPAPSRATPSADADRAGEAYAGLRVADFSWVGVGPISAKSLADHGATVVHVESIARPDVLRALPPFRDGVPGINRSQFFADYNSSKLGLALNLATPEGVAVARRLIRWADVVVDSFTPGTMERLGLDPDVICAGQPDLVWYSTSLRGATGPHAAFAGFGQQGSALAGLHGITGWPDRAPAGTWGAYTDMIAPRYGTAALGAALLERRRSGRGQRIDLAQVEAGIHFLEPLVLDDTVNGRAAAAAGHESPLACPHGVYAAAGVERYVAIAVEMPAQWDALRAAAGLEACAPAGASLADRIAARDAINAALGGWCATQDARAIEERLAVAGVPASVCQRPSDLYRDPQLAARGFFVTLDHPEMGPTPYDGLVTHFSAKREMLHGPAPLLGQHTHQVLSRFLGMSDAEIANLAAAGVLS